MTSQINISELLFLAEAMGLSCFNLERNTLKIISSLNAHSIFPEMIAGDVAAYMTDLVEDHCILEDIDLVKEELSHFKRGRKNYWAGIFKIRKTEEQSAWVYMRIYRSEENAFEPFNSAYCIIAELDPAEINKEQLNVFTAEIRKEANAERIKKLTSREIEVVRLISKGYSYTGIAKKLNIQPDTVNCHRKSILKKLGISNIAMISCFASEVGLI